MSVSGTPVTTYGDGFPKAHPSLPPSPRRDLTRLRAPNLPTTGWLEFGRDRRSISRESFDARLGGPSAREPGHWSRRSDLEHRGEGGRGGWGLGKPVVVRSGQAYRQPTGGRWARQSDRV